MLLIDPNKIITQFNSAVLHEDGALLGVLLKPVSIHTMRNSL